QMVVLEVRSADHLLRAATDAEVAAWKAERAKARKVAVPRADLRTTELRPLVGMRRRDAAIYGAKAANLGEVVRAHKRKVFVPEGFGIPFSAYADHMKRNHLDAAVAAALADARFKGDAEWRKQAC